MVVAVEAHLSLKKRALLRLLNLHGLRIGEAIERTPDDLDPKRWTLTLPNTKDGNPYTIALSEPVIEAIKAYDWRSETWLFGTAQRSNIARDLKKACDKSAFRISQATRSAGILSHRRSWRTVKACPI